MKTTTIFTIFILALTANLFAGIEETKSYIYFETDRAELTEESQQILDEIFTQAMASADYEIAIIGHTDSRGSINYNQDLSLRRAASVKDYFLTKGIAEYYVTTDYKGELQPAKPNINDDYMGKNRRVEVVLISYAFENVQELEQALVPNKVQVFQIEPQKEQLIEGKRGSKILIPENAFVDCDGKPVTEKVNIEVVEALSFVEFLSSGLETRSGDKLLESGGMIKITATTESGEEVILDSNREVFIAVPDEQRRDGMNVFVSEGGQNWVDTERPINNKPQKIENDFPKLQVDKSAMPRFTYNVKPPKEPKKPYMPREPTEPRVESFYKKVPWYKLNKKKIQEGQKRRYERAMDRYYWRLDRFDKRSGYYDAKFDKYMEKVLDYERKLAIWNHTKDSLEANFRRSEEYQRALKYKKEMDENYVDQFEVEVEDWYSERESNKDKWNNGVNGLGMNQADLLSTYVFPVNQLNWINIDRFQKLSPRNRRNVVFQSEDLENEKVMILFKNIRSVINCYADQSRSVFYFDDLPMEEEKILMAIKIVDQKPMVCFRKMDAREEYVLEYRPSSFAEIRRLLIRMG